MNTQTGYITNWLFEDQLKLLLFTKDVGIPYLEIKFDGVKYTHYVVNLILEMNMQWKASTNPSVNISSGSRISQTGPPTPEFGLQTFYLARFLLKTA